MAPTQSKRPRLRTKTTSRTPTTSHLPRPSSPSTLFASTKKDKRISKHSTFVHKIEKSGSKAKKRRRPNKSLAANLESLADALPDFGLGEEDRDGDGKVVVGQATIQRRSLKSRPGAMKRKEKVERMERERFNKNMAQMAGGSTQGSGGAGSTASIADRWAALKGHVQSTSERKAEFVKG